MSRSISQIYAEAVAKRNDYLQLSSLDSGRSDSKLSVINILTYVMSVLIYSYEVLLDVFQVQMAQLINKRVNGTARYYAEVALFFQYNQETQSMDELTFDEKTLKISFKDINTSHRIIAKSAYQNYKDAGTVIKVCKANSSNEDGTASYQPLSESEMYAFSSYMDEIKFLGTKLTYRSIPGDLLSINATIVYDDLYVTEAQALQNVKEALIAYNKSLGFNSYIYYQSIIDVIQNAEHIITVYGVNSDTSSSEESYAKVIISSYDETKKAYTDSKSIIGRCTPESGYLTFVDAFTGQSTLVTDKEHLVFVPNSSL